MKPHHIQICCSMACTRRGAQQLKEYLESKGHTVQQTGCQNCCQEGPTIIVDNSYCVTGVKPSNAQEKIENAQRIGEKIAQKRSLSEIDSILTDLDSL